MLRRVASRQQGHTNNSLVARSAILTYLKLMSLNLPFKFSHCLTTNDVDTTTSSLSCTRCHCVVQTCSWSTQAGRKRTSIGSFDRLDIETMRRTTRTPTVSHRISCGIEKLRRRRLRKGGPLVSKLLRLSIHLAIPSPSLLYPSNLVNRSSSLSLSSGESSLRNSVTLADFDV